MYVYMNVCMHLCMYPLCVKDPANKDCPVLDADGEYMNNHIHICICTHTNTHTHTHAYTYNKDCPVLDADGEKEIVCVCIHERVHASMYVSLVRNRPCQQGLSRIRR